MECHGNCCQNWKAMLRHNQSHGHTARNNMEKKRWEKKTHPLSAEVMAIMCGTDLSCRKLRTEVITSAQIARIGNKARALKKRERRWHAGEHPPTLLWDHQAWKTGFPPFPFSHPGRHARVCKGEVALLGGVSPRVRPEKKTKNPEPL